MQEENPLNYMFLDEEPVNYREKIEKYLAYWKWFLGCAFIALICAKIYLRYTPNQYQVATTILIENEENTGLGSDLSALQNLGLGGNSATLVENEMGILQSRTLMENVVKDLGLNVSYYHEGTIKTNELFGANSPIKINFFSKDSIFYKLDTVFRIAIKSPTKFVLTSGDELQASEHVFGENIVSKIGNFTITPRNIKEDLVDTEVLVRVSPLKSTVQNYKGRLGVDFLTEYSDILKITLNGQIEQKASVILNNLVMHYNKNAIENKSQLAINTNNFIVKRLEVISQDLSDIDKGVQQFKTTNKLTDIPEEASLIVKTNAKLEQEIIDVNTQLKLTAYVTEYLASNSADLIPANVGLSDGAVSANTSKYNQLLLERNRILTSSSNLNPVIINLNNQIKELRASVSQSLVNFTSSLTIKLNSLKQQEAILNSKIIAVPGQERAYRDIERQQQIIEELYLYLLEKREENAISLAATMPNATVIDRADGSGTPISPNSKKIYLIALFLGLAIPFVLIYIRFLLDNKVHTAKEVEDAIKAPFLGELPHTKLEKKLVVSDTERSNEAEAFRMLRTNMNFMLSNVKEKGETIYVTSTIPNEGKTFI